MNGEGSPKRIQRKRTKGWKMPDGAIYVGRPTRWANPFPPDGPEALGADLSLKLFADITRGVWNPTPLGHLNDQSYARLYEAQRAWRARLHRHPTEVIRSQLQGHDLVCWCPIKDEQGQRTPCHADVLLHLANPGWNP